MWEISRACSFFYLSGISTGTIPASLLSRVGWVGWVARSAAKKEEGGERKAKGKRRPFGKQIETD